MGTVQERKVLARLIQESLVQVVKGNAIFGSNFELDGLICLSGTAMEHFASYRHCMCLVSLYLRELFVHVFKTDIAHYVN